MMAFCTQVSVLDYQSTQLKLMPLLAQAYCLHFAKDHLVRIKNGNSSLTVMITVMTAMLLLCACPSCVE
jgi:hypothetical protein